MLPAVSPPPASPSRSNSAFPPDPPPSVIRTHAHPEHLLCLPPGPKRKSHIWRPEHQKFIELFTFPKAQLATRTAVCGGVSPSPASVARFRVTPRSYRPESGWGAGWVGGGGERTRRGEVGSGRVETSGWKSQTPSMKRGEKMEGGVVEQAEPQKPPKGTWGGNTHSQEGKTSL